MATPALLIGLGGTGVKVLTLVKQDLMANHKDSAGKPIVPPEVQLLALDTEAQSDEKIGVTKTKTAEASVASLIKLEKEKGEYVWVGGAINDYVRDVARGKYPHVSSWLQAVYYLDTLPDALFYLEAGAGMLRQFGRLAIFHDVVKGAGLSKIYRLLKQAIERVQRARKGETIQVILVSSVAGGTGAGMYTDIAYLIRQIADRELKVNVVIRGYLVMPEAFSSIPSGITADMRARAYAAMRESKRFMVKPDWDLGYPMYYHGIEGHPTGEDVWQGRIKSKLFDFLYHIDGRRPNNRLDTLDMWLGVAPTIADVISASLDDDGGRAFDKHKLNLNEAVGGAVDKTAFYGTVGTYTIVLPIYYIIEEFSHRLSLEALNILLAPRLGKDGLPEGLQPDKNAEVGEGQKGRESASAFLDLSQVVDNQDREVGVETTPFIREIARVARQIALRKQDQERAALAGRDVPAWIDYFKPLYGVPESTHLEIQAILNRRATGAVLTSEKMKEKPVDGIQRIEGGVKSFKATFLGPEREGGKRTGGEFRKALEKYLDIHLGTFRKMLNTQCNNILNGKSAEDYCQARGGKLGYVLDFLEGLVKETDGFLVLLGEARDARESRGERGSAMDGARSALETMKENASSGFPGRAVGAQRKYLEAEQYLVDILRYEVLEQIVTETAQGMLDYAKSARNQVQAWANALGIGKSSLYADVQLGRNQVAVNRKDEKAIRARRQIEDKDYEEELYTEYAMRRGDRVNEMLGSLVWGTTTKEVGTKKEFSLVLSITIPEADKPVFKPMTLDVRKHNMDTILGRSRRLFDEIWQRESVLKYLRAKFTHEELGEELFDNGGPLLKFGAVPAGAKIVPANYLRVFHGEDPGEIVFLTDLLTYVANKSNTESDKFAATLQSVDRFRCSLIYTLDLIPLRSTDSFKDAEGDYLRWQPSGVLGKGGGGVGREILHLFPAEVNAVRFEQRASTELQHEVRLFEDDVVCRLEDIQRFRLFASCLAFGLINIETETPPGGQPETFYQLELPEEEIGPFDKLPYTPLHLTVPQSGKTPDMLEALTTFAYRGSDVRTDQLTLSIDYARVGRALEAARKKKAEIKISKVKMEKPIQALFASAAPEKQQRVKHLLAQREYIVEERDEKFGGVIKKENTNKIMRDLSTCLYLSLGDEIRSLEIAVRDILQR